MARLLVLALVLSIVSASGGRDAAASDRWTITAIDTSSLPREIVPEVRKPTSGGLPDGLISTYEGVGDIRSAWYEAPTTRYRHAILGDGIEAGALVVETPDGRELRLTLPQDQVFEDRYPRLADLDGDGRVEIITHLSSQDQGGSVAVFGISEGEVTQVGSSGFIGRPNRWQNVAGIADFRGVGSKQIAYVEIPHIGGTLYILEMQQGELERVGSLYGFSNHAIGSPEMRLSAVADADGDGKLDLAVPSADRHTLRIVGYDANGVLREIASLKLPASVDKAIAVTETESGPRFTVGTADGRVFLIGKAE